MVDDEAPKSVEQPQPGTLTSWSLIVRQGAEEPFSKITQQDTVEFELIDSPPTTSQTPLTETEKPTKQKAKKSKKSKAEHAPQISREPASLEELTPVLEDQNIPVEDLPSQTQSWSSIVSKTVFHEPKVIVTLTQDTNDKEENIPTEKAKKLSKKEKKISKAMHDPELTDEADKVVEILSDKREMDPTDQITTLQTQSWSSIVSQTTVVSSSHDIQDFIQKEQNFSTIVNDKPKKQKTKKEKNLQHADVVEKTNVIEEQTQPQKKPKKEKQLPEIKMEPEPIVEEPIVVIDPNVPEIVNTQSSTQSWSSIVSQTIENSAANVVPSSQDFIRGEQNFSTSVIDKPKKQKTKNDKKLQQEQAPIVEKESVVEEPKDAIEKNDLEMSHKQSSTQSWSSIVSQPTTIKTVRETTPLAPFKPTEETENNLPKVESVVEKPTVVEEPTEVIEPKKKPKKEKKLPKIQQKLEPIVQEPIFTEEPKELIESTVSEIDDTQSSTQSWSSIVSHQLQLQMLPRQHL
ncbi:hypothetical protein ACLKA6_019311 [Drosophila palustris]